MSEIKLRPWQAECTGKALGWFKKGLDRHFLINAAPGSGKTICASVIAKRMLDTDDIDSVIVIAPRKVLCHANFLAHRQASIGTLIERGERVQQQQRVPHAQGLRVIAS